MNRKYKIQGRMMELSNRMPLKLQVVIWNAGITQNYKLVYGMQEALTWESASQ